jgi:FkbM family methyltransferase
MGYLKEKYTRTYFMHKDDQNREVGYGALGVDEWQSGGIRDDVREILDLVSLADKDILEIGYGRGESARYLLGQKKARSYIGVDFSEDAFALANETLKPFPGGLWQLHCADALEFLRGRAFENCLDAILLIDCIEHIPRHEVDEMLPLLHRALCAGGYVVVYTPYYSIDEDFIAQGCQYIAPSASDLIPETRGMHCNKFTLERLIREFNKSGFNFVRDRIFLKPRYQSPPDSSKYLKESFSPPESSATCQSEQSKLDRVFTENPDGSCYVHILTHSYRVEPHWFWPEFVNGWEEDTWNVFSRYLRPDQIFLDVGAWVGPTVLFAATLGASRIVAVEANPATAMHLTTTVGMNPSLSERVVVVNACVSNCRGKVPFGNADGSHSTSSASSLRGHGFEVEAVRLGDLISQNGLENIAFLKIDIEGAELPIAEDLRLLSKRRNLAVHLSLHPPFWERMGDPADLWRVLESFRLETPQGTPITVAQVIARCTANDPYPIWGTPYGNFFEIVLLSDPL